MTLQMQMTKSSTRPKLHFAPMKNWINDPNGLVFYQGEWHLFFQYNPYGLEWGNMNWGHAVSADMIQWTELGIAIPEDEENMIFSGSCVIDWNNTSGFGSIAKPPMIAIYTDHKKKQELQVQSIAYSLDNGRTFTKYENNPVLDVNQKDFRDPKVFWFEPTKKWVMVVCNSSQNSISIYNSPDLKNWQIKSNFGPAGIDGRLWECPDLFELRVDGTDQTKWLLKVDVFEADYKKYSLGQAFIGDFDGEKFCVDKDENGQEIYQRIDFGHDFYASMSWSDVPQTDGRRIWTAWMNSHHYASQTPAASWRGSMAIPREVSLINLDAQIRIVQKPINELYLIKRQKLDTFGTHSLKDYAYLLDASFQCSSDKENYIELKFGVNSSIRFGYNPKENLLYIDRQNCGAIGKLNEFGEIQKAKRISADAALSLYAIIDYNSIEVFFDSGLQVFSEIFFPMSNIFKIETDNSQDVFIELSRFEPSTSKQGSSSE